MTTQSNPEDPLVPLNRAFNQLTHTLAWISAAADAISRQGNYTDPVREQVATVNHNLATVLQQITDLKHTVRHPSNP